MRYVVTKPMPGGFDWYRIADTLDPILPNAEIASVRKDVPGAERWITILCRTLNDLHERKPPA